MISIPPFIFNNNAIGNENNNELAYYSFPIVVPTPILKSPPQCSPIINISNTILINENNPINKGQNFNSTFENNNMNFNLLHQCTNKKKLRNHFTKEEDARITELVKIFGTHNWILISQFMKGRSPKQIRDRYSNYLMPGIFHGDWTKEEDELLIKLYSEHGSKWTIIQNFLPNRSTNSIKNRWYYFLNKKNKKETRKKQDNHSFNSSKTNEIIENEIDKNKSHSIKNGSFMNGITEIDILGDLNFEDWY